MLAALLLNPYVPSIGGKPEGFHQLIQSLLCWDEDKDEPCATKEEVKKLVVEARRVIPKSEQVGMLHVSGYKHIPPISKINLDALARDADRLMALANAIEKQYARDARRREEEDLLIQIFLN